MGKTRKYEHRKGGGISEKDKNLKMKIYKILIGKSKFFLKYILP
jgi:hypothetical protein